MSRPVFARATARLLARLGKPVLLRGEATDPPRRAQIEHGADFADSNEEAVYSRSLATLSKVDGPHTQGDTLVEIESGATFSLDQLISDNGFTQRWTLLGDSTDLVAVQPTGVIAGQEFTRATARLLQRLGVGVYLHYELADPPRVVAIEHGVDFADRNEQSIFSRSVATLNKVDGPFSRGDPVEEIDSHAFFVLDSLIKDNGYSQQWTLLGKVKPLTYADAYADHYADYA